MAFQAKLIEEDLWRIFAEPFYFFLIHIKIWQPNEDPRGLHEENNLRAKFSQNSYLPLWPPAYLQEVHYTTSNATDG